MTGSSGRGPTMAISPRSTLRSCGSSSIFRRRSHAPSGNTRGSSAPVMTLASERRRACMVRSLYMMNGRPPRPTRSARYNTAPGLARRIPTAARASRGAVATNAIAAHTTSTRRLTIADRAADGHEHLRRIETLLVSPGPRAVAQRLERAGVRIGTQLALIACHGGELLVERRGDVHPGVRGERARKRPLGAAGRVEGVDCFNASLGRAGRHESRPEKDLVVAVDVAAVLAVHDARLDFADDALERRDELGERDGVEPLVGKPQRTDVADAERGRCPAHVLALAHARRPVAERLAFAGDDRGDPIPGLRMQGHRAAAAEDLVVGVGGDDEDAASHRRSRRMGAARVGRAAPGARRSAGAPAPAPRGIDSETAARAGPARRSTGPATAARPAGGGSGGPPPRGAPPPPARAPATGPGR